MSMAATRRRQRRSLFESAIHVVEQARLRLDPDEDWEPTIITRQGVYIVRAADEAAAAGLDGTDAISTAIRHLPHVHEVALIETVWAVVHPPGSPEQRFMQMGRFDDVPRPREDPRRSEWVMVYGLRCGEKVQAAWAPVTRRVGLPPLLGHWQRGGAGGRIAVAMQATVSGG